MISRSSNKHRFFLFLCLLLLMSFTKASAIDLKHPLKIEGVISTGKHLFYEKCIPVTVDITNLGGDFTGRISLVLPVTYGSGTDSFYYQDVRIPREGSKRYFLYAPVSKGHYPNDVKIRVTQNKQYREISIPFTRLQTNDKLLMAITPQQSGFSQLTGFSTIAAPNAGVYLDYPNPAKLPIHWKGFDNVSAVIINNLPMLNLDKDVEQALLDYVIAGGTIIFTSGLNPNEYKGTVFSEHIPLIPTGTILIENFDPLVDRFPTQLLLEGTLRGDILLDYNNMPLVLKKSLGLGNIFLVTADLTKSPFTADFEENTLWPLLTSELSSYSASDIQGIDLIPALSQQPELSLPPLELIFWILAFYIVMIGPLNYYYLKKKDRLILLFLTVPFISIIFSLSIFLSGYASKGSNIIFRKVDMVYGNSGSSGYFVESAAILFSPSNTLYTLSLKEPQATGWIHTHYNYDSQGSNVNQNSALAIEDISVPMWSMKAFRLQNSVSLEGEINVKITLDPDLFRGFIENKSGKKLTNCILFNNGSISNLFNLDHGVNQIDLPVLKHSIVSERELEDNYALLLDKNNQKGHQNDSLIKQQKSVLAPLASAVFRTTNRTVLIGWSEEPALGIDIANKRYNFHNHTVFFIK